MTNRPNSYLRHLEHILLLAKTLNFTKAAQLAHLSQSAFSKSIAAFEKKIGVPVFKRTTSYVEITELGQDVIEEIRHMVFEMNNFEKNVQNLKHGEYGRIAFGSGPYPAKIFAPTLLKEFHLAHPGVHLDLKIDYWNGLLRKLYNSEIDFFIADIRSLEKLEYLDITPIGGITISFFCDKNHPLLQGLSSEVLPAEKLMNYAFASLSLPDAIFNDLKTALGLPPSYMFNLTFKCDNLEYITAMLCNTEIIGISSNYIMNHIDHQPQIVPLPVSMSQNRFGNWALVKIKNRKLSPASAKLANKLIESIRQCSLYDQMHYGLENNKPLNFLS